MRRFLLGAVVGAALVYGAFWWFPDWRPRSSGSAPPADPALARAPLPETADTPPLTLAAPPPAPPTPPPPAADRRALPADALAVRLGEGVDLVRWAVVQGVEARQADLVCLDLDGGSAVFGCRHGGAPLVTAGRSLFDVKDPATARSRAPNAPERLESRTVRVGLWGSGALFAYVAGPEGGTWTLWIEAIDPAPSALDRVAWIRKAAAERRPDGGNPALAEVFEEATGPTSDRIESLLARGQGTPGFPASTAKAFQGTWRRVTAVPRDSRMNAFHQRIVLGQRVEGGLETGAWASLVAEEGTGPDAKLTLEHHSTVLVPTDFEGEADVEDHATLVIEGDLVGTVRVRNHGIVHVEGRVRGTLQVGWFGRALLLHGAGGELRLSEASSAYLLLGGGVTREEIARMPTPGGDCELYLERSDLSEGSHDDVPGWKAVVVGGERWALLRR